MRSACGGVSSCAVAGVDKLPSAANKASTAIHHHVRVNRRGGAIVSWVAGLFVRRRHGTQPGLLLAAAALGWAWPLAAQTNNSQSWWDIDFRAPITPRWSSFAEVGARVLLSDGPGWSSVRVTPGIEHAATPWLDVLGLMPLVGTVQQEDLSTFEVRPVVGVRLSLRPNPRLVLRNRNLAELRIIEFLGSDSSQTSLRLRFRVEARVAINQPVLAGSSGLLYGLTDFEGFLNVGAAPSERFLNRTRFRIGLGYRFSYWWTVEGIYTLQLSANTLSALEPDTHDHILRFRLVHFFR
jgi:hypothetical protein